MALFVQFLLRLTFGLAAGMAITSPKQVTSGYYRNHLYVTLGLSCLAALLSHSAAAEVFWYCVGAAVLSYLGAVCWLYEAQAVGKVMLAAVALIACCGSVVQNAHMVDAQDLPAAQYGARADSPQLPARTRPNPLEENSPSEASIRPGGTAGYLLALFAPVSSGLLLGTTMASMLLGHWYLNSPTMELRPLYHLLVAMIVALFLQTIVSAFGLGGELTNLSTVSTQWLLFVLLRWVFGLVGVGVLIFMTWQTLKIPNTQSATGILYVAVIGTFVGETMALLLSAESLFPL